MIIYKKYLQNFSHTIQFSSLVWEGPTWSHLMAENNFQKIYAKF